MVMRHPAYTSDVFIKACVVCGVDFLYLFMFVLVVVLHGSTMLSVPFLTLFRRTCVILVHKWRSKNVAHLSNFRPVVKSLHGSVYCGLCSDEMAKRGKYMKASCVGVANRESEDASQQEINWHDTIGVSTINMFIK